MTVTPTSATTYSLDTFHLSRRRDDHNVLIQVDFVKVSYGRSIFVGELFSESLSGLHRQRFIATSIER